MPRFRDLSVHITDSKGNDLKEWGVQNLRNQNKASTYIQATTNMAFKITMQPRFPFRNPDFSSASHNDLTMDDRLGPQEPEELNDEFENPDLRATEDSHLTKKKEPIINYSLNIAYNHRRTKSYNRFSDSQNRNSGPSNEHPLFSSPAALTDDDLPVPFHLLASLFLDGRQKAERKVIVYLDPDDEDYAFPDGKVHFRSRWVQGNDGSVKEHSWVFKDVGIETVFDRMLISDGKSCAEIREEPDEDVVVAALSATGLGVERNVEEDKNHIGQILVVVERVVLGRKWEEDHYRSKHQEGEEAEDVDMAGVKNEITHTTGLKHTGTRSSRPVRVVEYSPYKVGEMPYATFQFFYRSQETLEKFGFPGFPCSRKRSARDRRHMEDTFADVTPLSIAHPVPLSKRKGRSFEENVKEGTFPQAEKKYKGNDTHRQLAAVKVNSNGLSERKHAPSITSTLSSIKSAPTSPLKRCVQVLATSHRGDEQTSCTEYSCVRPNGFTAEQTSHAAFSKFSLLKSTESGADTLSSSGLLSSGLDHSTLGISTNLTTKSQEAETKEGPIKPPSSVLRTVDTKAAAELSQSACSDYRGSGQASDADDERDESDIDPLIGTNENTDADRLNHDPVASSVKQDDQGLHTELQAMVLIQSYSHRTKKGKCSSESGGTSPSKTVETKMERSPSMLGLSSGTAEDADEEDNANKENSPPIERAGQLLLHHRIKRTKS